MIKTRLLCAIVCSKDDCFTKTGSGQIYGTLRKRVAGFLAGQLHSGAHGLASDAAAGGAVGAADSERVGDDGRWRLREYVEHVHRGVLLGR